MIIRNDLVNDLHKEYGCKRLTTKQIKKVVDTYNLNEMEIRLIFFNESDIKILNEIDKLTKKYGAEMTQKILENALNEVKGA